MNKKTTLLFFNRALKHTFNNSDAMMNDYLKKGKIIVTFFVSKIEKTKIAIASYNIQDNIELEETT